MNKRLRKKQLKKINAYVSPKETWSLDCTMSKYILPRLKAYKKHTNGYPGSMASMDEWYAILDKMILAFTHISEERIFEVDFKSGDEIDKQIDEGLDLFRKYYFDLWW